MPKKRIYLYVEDNGDNSVSVNKYTTQEERDNAAALDEERYGYTLDGSSTFIDIDPEEYEDCLNPY